MPRSPTRSYADNSKPAWAPATRLPMSRKGSFVRPDVVQTSVGGMTSIFKPEFPPSCPVIVRVGAPFLKCPGPESATGQYNGNCDCPVNLGPHRVRKCLPFWRHHPGPRSRGRNDVGVAGRKEPASAEAAEQGAAGDLSGARAHPRPGALLDPGHAAPRDRLVLARPSGSRRPAGACAGGEKRDSGRLVVAARFRAARRPARHLPGSAHALSRAGSRPRTGLLLRVRTAGLSPRLASRPVAPRGEPQRRLARRLRGGLGPVDGAERLCPRAPAPAGPTLRRNRRPIVEDRGSRSPRPAVSGMARAPRHALA